MDYGKIIKRALTVTWRHKVLWVFGIAATIFGSRAGGTPNTMSNSMRYAINSGDIQRWRQAMPWLPGMPFARGGPFMPPLMGQSSAMPFWLGLAAIILALVFVLFIVGIIVRYTGLGALVGMVDEVERVEQTSFKSGLQRGWSRFLRLFAIELLIGLATFVVVVVLLIVFGLGALLAAGPIIATAENAGGPSVLAIIWAVAVGLGLLLLLILVILALAAATTLWREFSWRASVLGSEGVFEALRAGFTLARRRLREGLLMWLLLLGINLALSLAAIPFALLGIGGLVGPALAIWGLTRSAAAIALYAVPALIVLVLISHLIQGIYLTFRSAVWTLTYRELTS